MPHSSITRQLALSWIRGRLSGEPKLSGSISNINHSDYFSTKSLGGRRGGVGGMPLISHGEMMSALVGEKNPFSLGEPAWTPGPWKLSNNNGPPAKSPHLLGCTTLSWWFLSICSLTQTDIQANHHDCFNQHGPIRADMPNSTQRQEHKLCVSKAAAGLDWVERLKKYTNSSTAVSMESNYVSFLPICWTNSTSRLDSTAFV